MTHRSHPRASTACRALLAWSLALAPSAAVAEERLVVHHFLGPTAPQHAQFVLPWARRVEADSGGEIRVDIFPSMALGGKPPDLYRQLRDGAVDIVWTVIGYTPGVFPRTEVFELPSVHRGSARATNLAIQVAYDDMLAEDFADIHPILVHAHTGNALHVSGDEIAGVEDLAGAKLRTPSRTGAWMIEAWGAEPVGMPLPALPQALSKGTVEGALIPFEVVIPTRVHELTDYSLEGSNRFGTSVFLFAMNKDRYGSLPPRLRDVIDANSGAALAAAAGDVSDAVEEPGKRAQLESGGRLLEITAAAQAEFDARARQVEARWIRAADEAGLPGEEMVRKAKAAVAQASR